MAKKKSSLLFKIIALFTPLLVGALALASFFITKAPLHYYNKAKSSGIQNAWLTLAPTDPSWLSPLLTQKNSTSMPINRLWHAFHFGNFEIVLPTHHPQYILSAWPYESTTPMLGLHMADSVFNLQFSFRPRAIEFWPMGKYQDKIFQLPFFQEFIKNKTPKQIWSDIFSRKLEIKKPTLSQNLPQIFSRLGFDPLSMVYDLYILKLRQSFLPSNCQSIAFNQEENFGIIELKKNDQDKNMRKQIIYFFSNSSVYSIELYSRQFSQLAEETKKIFIQNLKLRPTTVDSTISIYSEYKALSYKQKIDQEGMIYLLAAWSHDMQNKEFLKEMIQYLERGKDNLYFLHPLYEWSIKKYGDSFSKSSDNFQEKEDEQIKLERKIKDEIDQEMANQGDILPDSEGNFKNPEDKINYFLKRAKRSGVNSDEDEAILEK